jgi:RNA polymerase sigma-70 factor (ECF subfamily)
MSTDVGSAKSASGPTVENLIQCARGGDGSKLGQLLQLYRNYLRLLADSQLDRKLRARVCPSDVVQEAMLDAYRGFGQFRGRTQREFLAWLRQILINNVFRMVERHVLTGKRDVRREVSLEQIGRSVEHSGLQFQAILADDGTSPSDAVNRAEHEVRLADCIARLRPQYREVIVLRNFKCLPFERVAEDLGRSIGATRVLWLRAVKRLRQSYFEGTDP